MATPRLARQAWLNGRAWLRLAGAPRRSPRRMSEGASRDLLPRARALLARLPLGLARMIRTGRPALPEASGPVAGRRTLTALRSRLARVWLSALTRGPAPRRLAAGTLMARLALIG